MWEMSIPPIYFLKNWPAAEYEWQKNLKMQALPKSASIRFWFKKWILWKKSLLQLKFVRDITDNCKGDLQVPKKLTKKKPEMNPNGPQSRPFNGPSHILQKSFAIATSPTPRHFDEPQTNAQQPGPNEWK